MPNGFIETGSVTETLPVPGAGTESSNQPLNIQERESAPPPPAPTKPPPQKARDRLFSSLDKKAGITAPPNTESQAQAEGQGDSASETEHPNTDTNAEAGAEDQSASETPPASAAKPASKKESPWKLVESYKQRAKTLEAEVADLKSRIAPENDVQDLRSRLEKAESALKDKEDFIRLHRYEQSEEYRDKYQKPYESAWAKAAKKMSEISITDPGTGQERPANLHDMEQLVNAPLGQARKMAEEIFGGFANDAMNMREKIVELYEAQAEAIANEKKSGSEREKQQTETMRREAERFQKAITATWQKVNEEAVANEQYGHYFKPREGDETWNTYFNKGVDLVNKAFATIRPAIDPKNMEETVRLHAAIRNRAIAFGPLRHENEKLKAEVKAWREKYEAISKSTPPAANGVPRGTGQPAHIKARDRLDEALEKIAHPQ